MKVRTEFSNVWGEYKNHSNPYIQGTTVPCDISCLTVLEINFEEAAYLTTEGSLLNILLQFRGTQSPFTLTLRSVSIDSAEISSVGGLSNCTSIGQDSKATPGTKYMDVPESYVGI